MFWKMLNPEMCRVRTESKNLRKIREECSVAKQEDLSSSAQNTHKKTGMVVQLPVALLLRVGR